MENYLDTMFVETRNIIELSYQIKCLSRSFYETGNNIMGETLSIISKNLEESAETINKAVGKELNDTIKVTEQTSINMLAACLSVSDQIKNNSNIKQTN